MPVQEYKRLTRRQLRSRLHRVTPLRPRTGQSRTKWRSYCMRLLPLTLPELRPPRPGYRLAHNPNHNPKKAFCATTTPSAPPSIHTGHLCRTGMQLFVEPRATLPAWQHLCQRHHAAPVRDVLFAPCRDVKIQPERRRPVQPRISTKGNKFAQRIAADVNAAASRRR